MQNELLVNFGSVLETKANDTDMTSLESKPSVSRPPPPSFSLLLHRLGIFETSIHPLTGNIFGIPASTSDKWGAVKSELTYVSALAVLLLSSSVQSRGQEQRKPAGVALVKHELRNVKAEAVHYLGGSGMRVCDAEKDRLDDSGRLAVV